MRPSRRVFAAILLAATPGLAQQHASPPPVHIVSGLAPLAPPLPEIGLPLASMGLGPETRTTTEPVARTPASASRHGRGGGWFFSPVYVWMATAPPETAAAWRGIGRTPSDGPAPVVAPPSGVVHLDIQPRLPQQIWVDGAFVGAAGDLGSELRLVAGRHRIELREPGYLPLVFEVEIAAERAITYRERLTPDPSSPAPPSAQAAGDSTGIPPPIPRKLLYWIPGCYMGDVQPRDAGLPATCDPAKAVVYRP